MAQGGNFIYRQALDRLRSECISILNNLGQGSFDQQVTRALPSLNNCLSTLYQAYFSGPLPSNITPETYTSVEARQLAQMLKTIQDAVARIETLHQARLQAAPPIHRNDDVVTVGQDLSTYVADLHDAVKGNLVLKSMLYAYRDVRCTALDSPSGIRSCVEGIKQFLGVASNAGFSDTAGFHARLGDIEARLVPFESGRGGLQPRDPARDEILKL